MMYGKNEELKSETLFFTENMEDVITEYETLKDLGVHMNNSANWSRYVTNVAKKSRQKFGWILRSFHNRNTHFMKHMFKTLVTLHIHYTSQLWMPITCTEIEKLEKNPERFLQVYSITLWPVDEIKLLGTTLTNDLIWDKNTDNIVKKKPFARMDLLKKLHMFGASIADLKKVYITFIRSHREQSSSVWPSILTVQKKQTKKLKEFKNLPLKSH